MRERLLLMLVATLVLVASFAFAAFADLGAPGTTFPEQPGSNPATACAVVGEILATGEAVDHASLVALGIVTQVYFDACVEEGL